MSRDSHFLGYVLFETDKALMFIDHFWHYPDWMPKSQAQVIRSPGTQEVEIIATAWICGKKGVEEFTEVTEEPEKYGA